MNVTIPCLCPPRGTGEARHPDGDTVTLRDPLDFRTVVVIRQSIGIMQKFDGDANLAELAAMLQEVYVLHCIDAWTLVDDKGKPVPVTKPEITDRLLTAIDAAVIVGDAADDLYFDRYIRPLLKPASGSSLPSRTGKKTSATNGSGPKHRTPSRRSSTSTIQTAGIAATP